MKPIKTMLLFLLLSGGLFLVFATLMIVIQLSRISMPAQKTIDLFQKLFEHSGYAILTLGIDRNITNANPAAEKILQGALRYRTSI